MAGRQPYLSLGREATGKLHSPGLAVYVVESEGLKVLFGQDVHGPLYPGLLSNRKEYHRSLHLLLDLEADILCEGHYGVYRSQKEAAAFIQRFLS
jgi:glyoxylase-like metal-dependent hydrolase (beta-lactamase superfamily II)